MMNELICGRAIWLGLAGLVTLLPALSGQVDPDAVVRHHAAWCHHLYKDVEQRAKGLQVAVEALIRTPTKESLQAAKNAWLHARQAYGQTEALRFHDGPIEPLEPLLNAWPVDEAYIDYVAGRPNCGIIQSPEQFPSLAGAVLELANERGGEANICVGWHAIEFVLWGQDLQVDGPGERPVTDFQKGKGRYAARRCEFLRAVTLLLVGHLHELTAAWQPGRDNYRRKFCADVPASVRRILIGVTVMTAFELGGERLTVAFDTRDQEQEHSCFSDATWHDFVANQIGIEHIVFGASIPDRSAPSGVRKGPGLIDLLPPGERELSQSLRRALIKTRKALQAMPQPFDQGVLAADGSAPRKAIAAAITSLEQQTEVLLILGKQLGHDLPLAPGG